MFSGCDVADSAIDNLRCSTGLKVHSDRTMKAIQIHETGGPEVLELAELPIPQPGPGQVLIRVEAVGVNFIEIYFRKGVYKAALPLTPGSEAAGTVEELGPGVTGFAAGTRWPQRACWAAMPSMRWFRRRNW